MRYAQILMGVNESGKSTYCKMMTKYAESKGRKMRIVNLDPTPGELVYDHPIADIREVVTHEEIMEAEQTAPGTCAGFEVALGYIIAHPEWLFDSIREVKDGDYVLFDCPGNNSNSYYVHSNAMKLFATMLVVQNFRTCGIYVRDARHCTTGYNYISTCLTPVASYINLAIPHVGLMMKVDLLSDEEKAKLQLFINSDIKDVLRYENARTRNLPAVPPGQPELAKYCSTAVVILDGHNVIRKKFYALDINEEDSFKGFLEVVDEVLGIPMEED